ncbi:MAG: PQQ-binding-like beta-propeller repeat protein [Actinomycetota bacterium]
MNPINGTVRVNRHWPAILMTVALLAAASCESRDDAGSLVPVWTHDTGGPVGAPPIAVGDVVVVAPDGEPIVALDMDTGAVRWTFDSPDRIWHRTLATDGDRLFFGLDGGRLAAIDVTSGAPIWEQALGIDTQHAPYVGEGILYVPTAFVGPGLEPNPDGNAKVFALDAADGEIIWEAETGNYILQTPSQSNGVVFVAGVFSDPVPIEEGGHTRILALSPDDGSMLWAYESEDGFAKGLYATDEVLSFIGYQDFANGIDTSSGELLWRRHTDNWVPDLAGSGDAVYFGSANTVVHAVSMPDGEAIWEYDIPEGTFNYVLGAPVPADGVLYFVTQQGDVMALDAENGSQLWHQPTDIAARTGPTVHGELLLVGDAEGTVHAFRLPGT